MRFFTSGTIAGILSFASMLAAQAGAHGVADWLNDPNAVTAMTWLAGFFGVAAGALEGVKPNVPVFPLPPKPKL